LLQGCHTILPFFTLPLPLPPEADKPVEGGETRSMEGPFDIGYPEACCMEVHPKRKIFKNLTNYAFHGKKPQNV
jgi:hypothetical protein